ncbi:hypothetical protein ACSBR2_011395 [Camellia fascicularis]
MNSFHGTFAAAFTKGNMLRNLNLNGNQIKGQVPRSLLNCEHLEVLDLGINKINDTFPHCWLEYSIAKDAAFCLCFYLFKTVVGNQGGGKSFLVDRFSSWKKNEMLQGHVGGVNSSHNQAWRKWIPLHGHDEFEDSSNQINFLELLMLLSNQNENLRAVLSKDVPEHLKLTAPSIQKDIVNTIVDETTNAIIRELGDGMFSIVFDKYWDASMEEQLIVSLRYVDGKGYVIVHFLGIKKISSSSVLSLKKAVEDLFSAHIEDISRLRRQSYDEQRVIHIATLFYVVSKVVKVVGAPCNHQDVPRENVKFSNLKGISDFARNMVETRKERIYFLVYKLLTLALILLVATATIEWAFSTPKIVKNRLHNENGDQLMNDSLVVYIEGEICNNIPNEAIMHHSQNMESL